MLTRVRDELYTKNPGPYQPAGIDAQSPGHFTPAIDTKQAADHESPATGIRQYDIKPPPIRAFTAAPPYQIPQLDPPQNNPEPDHSVGSRLHQAQLQAMRTMRGDDAIEDARLFEPRPTTPQFDPKLHSNFAGIRAYKDQLQAMRTMQAIDPAEYARLFRPQPTEIRAFTPIEYNHAPEPQPIAAQINPELEFNYATMQSEVTMRRQAETPNANNHPLRPELIQAQLPTTYEAINHFEPQLTQELPEEEIRHLQRQLNEAQRTITQMTRQQQELTRQQAQWAQDRIRHTRNAVEAVERATRQADHEVVMR